MKKIRGFFFCIKYKVSNSINSFFAKYRLRRQKKSWLVAKDEFNSCFDMDVLSLSYLSKEEQNKFIKQLTVARNKIHLETL
jgi:hypothetical protein